MNVFKNTNIFKKLIIILVFMILFSSCCPTKVHAGISGDDIVALPAKIFYFAEKGILRFLNDLFTDSRYHSEIQAEVDNNGRNLHVITETLKVYLTPETIIKGKFIIFDANIFKNIDATDELYDSGIDAVSNGKISLRNVISGWYYALRNFAIVALLSVLVYVGIRMVVSSIASDKAKYKTMFKDWLIALCLLFFIHYIMIGILNMSSMITEAIGGGQNTDFIGKYSKIVSACLQERI